MHIAERLSRVAVAPAHGAIDILTLVNANNTATTDVSALIDELAAQQHGVSRTLFFPGPQTYLIDPRDRRLTNWTTPSHLTLHLDSGARFKAAPLVQVFIGSPVVAVDEQIFDVSAAIVRLRPNTTQGGRLTTIIATTTMPHHFSPGVCPQCGSGMRFRLTGAQDKSYNGAWGATFVLSPTSFSFEIANPPKANSSITANITIASFYWNAGSPADTDARPGGLHNTAPTAWVFPEWWGAVGAGQLGRNSQPPQRGAGHDSTEAVQFAFDSGAPVLFLQDYAVSKVTLCGGNRMIDGHNHFLIGNQLDNTTKTNAVFEIKAGSSVIQRIWVMGAFAETYESGAHWYTNDLNLWQPEFVRIEGMQFWWLPIALCIGALPSQTGPIKWQGEIVPDQQATNCPLSESSMTGLDFYGTVEAIHYNQPNGYLQITDSTIGVVPTGWVAAEGNAYPFDDAVALHIHYGSLDVTNCDLENVADEAWEHPGARTVNMTGGSLNLHNIIYEAMNSFYIGTHAGSGAEGSSVNIVWCVTQLPSHLL